MSRLLDESAADGTLHDLGEDDVYCDECKQVVGNRHLATCSWAAREEIVGDGTVTVPKERRRLLEVGGPVVHPKHYNEHPAGIECIDVVEHMTANLAFAVKHIWRNGLKKESYSGASEKESAVRDLHSAIWYIQREIERITQPFTMRKGPKARE